MRPQSSLLQSGKSAPPFCLLNQNGESICLSDLVRIPAKTQPMKGLALLFISSDWLAEDRRLLQMLQQAQTTLNREGISSAAVSSVDWERLYFLAQHLSLTFPLLYDPCCRYGKLYGTLWIPKFVTGRSLFGIASSGTIVSSQSGKNICLEETVKVLAH